MTRLQPAEVNLICPGKDVRINKSKIVFNYWRQMWQWTEMEPILLSLSKLHEINKQMTCSPLHIELKLTPRHAPIVFSKGTRGTRVNATGGGVAEGAAACSRCGLRRTTHTQAYCSKNKRKYIDTFSISATPTSEFHVCVSLLKLSNTLPLSFSPKVLIGYR